MTNEPERPIEHLLRAAANKRRQDAGAPLELHPADRRVLQGEVSRRFGRAGSRNARRARQWSQLWPRLAWGGALFAVLIGAVALLLPGPSRSGGDREMLLASKLERFDAPRQRAKEPWPPLKDTSIPSAIPAPATAPVPAAPASAEPKMLLNDGRPSLGLEESALPTLAAPPANRPGAQMVVSAAPPASAAPVAKEVPTLAYSAPAASTPPSGFASPQAPSVAGRVGGDLALNKQARQSFGQASQAELALRSRAPIASADGIGSSPPAKAELAAPTAESRLVQRYSQAGPPATARFDKTMAAAPVLSSFQVELQGRELKVIDADGSVYSGQVQAPRQAGGLRAAKANTPAATPAPTTAKAPVDRAAADLDQLVQQNYSFRVAGTNRTLRKKVVFTGDLISRTNVFLWRQSGGPASAAAPVDAYAWKSLPLHDSRITGKVVVGSGKAVPVDALPAKP